MYKFGSVQDVISLQEFVKEYDSGTIKVANTKAAKFAAELEKTAYTINKVLPAASKASRSLFKLSPNSIGRMGGGALGGALMGGAWGALSPDTPTNIFGQRQAPTFGDRVRSAAGNAFAFGTVGALGGLYSPKIKRFFTKPRVGGTPRTPTTPKPPIDTTPKAPPVDTPKVPVDTPKAPPVTSEAPPVTSRAPHPYYDVPGAPQGGPSVNRSRKVTFQTAQGGPPINEASRTYRAGTPPATPPSVTPETPELFTHVGTPSTPHPSSVPKGATEQVASGDSPISTFFKEKAMGAHVDPYTFGAPRPTVPDPTRGFPWGKALVVPAVVGGLYTASGMMPD